MSADLRPELSAEALRWADPRLLVGAILLCVALPLAVFAPTFAAMVGTWWRTEVFTHGFLVLPAFAYLVWRERELLATRPVRPAPWALVGILACGLLITLGELSASMTPAFFGLIGASIFTVVAALGWRVASTIWVPLLFLFFGVPFGEVFVPRLIDWTGDFTVAALMASGIPVYQEGPNIVIPSGSWSVVDACSGIRYLLASMFAGWLYAWLTYRSATRRLVFMLASVVVPIVANWFRAYLIVLLAHLSDNAIATGVDHYVYGWFFFGIVIGLLFWAGTLFREDREPIPPPRVAMSTLPAPARAVRRPVVRVGLAAVALMAAWQALSVWLAGQGDMRPLVMQAVHPAHGWQAVAAPGAVAWAPELRAPAATLSQVFEKEGARVALHLGIYRNQSQSSELVNSTNELAAVIRAPWFLVSNVESPILLGGDPHDVNLALARHRAQVLVVGQWYWIDGAVTTSDALAKAGLAYRRLRGRGDTSAWVAIYAIDDEDGKRARAHLRAFAADMGPTIDAALRETAAR